MIREIKFRIINTSTGAVRYSTLNNQFHSSPGWLDNSILSQFTGLYDKRVTNSTNAISFDSTGKVLWLTVLLFGIFLKPCFA